MRSSTCSSSSSYRSAYATGLSSTSYASRPPLSFPSLSSYRSRSSYDLSHHRTPSTSSSYATNYRTPSTASSYSSTSRDHSREPSESRATDRYTYNTASSYAPPLRTTTTSSTATSLGHASGAVTLTRFNQRKSSLDFSDKDISALATSLAESSKLNCSTSSCSDRSSSSGVSTGSSSSSYLYSPSARRSKYSLNSGGSDTGNSSPSPTNSLRSTSSSGSGGSARVTTKPSSLSGLTNLGNTCYMSAVLQALYATEALRDYVMSNQRSCLMSALGRLFEDMRSAESTVASPSFFRTQFIKLQNKFRGYDQQDAQEFLRYVINGLHDEQNRGNITGRKPFSPPTSASEAWSQYKTIDDSPLIDILGGQLSSVISCNTCGHRSVTWDPFLDLSLSLPSNCREADVDKCLQDFMDVEQLDISEKYVCEKCKVMVRATKRLAIERAPQVLILHLKRFSNDGYKLSRPVMKASPRISVNGKTYALYACVSHHGGSARSGHYTASCKVDGRWWNFNDERVCEKKDFEPSSDLEDAYILFYVETSCMSRL